jgi:hypothetical protein
MVNLLVARIILCFCGLLSSLLVMLLLLDYNERQEIKYYYVYVLIGVSGCLFMILGFISLQ